MMSNLFSIFDPSMSLFSLSWFCICLSLLFFSSFFWFFSFFNLIFMEVMNFFISETSYSLGYVSKGLYSWFCSIFFLIFSLNFFSMFFYFFSSTSHMLVTFPISFSLWFSIILFFLSYFFFNFLCHLIPSGTPVFLVSFMVLVEIISNLIRPIALTFRLTANMMAGHLLMSLMGGLLVNMSFSFMFVGSALQCLLVFMELGVSFIQAYVFTTLLMLYCSEINSH